MKKSDIKVMPEYFDQYINLTEDLPILECLEVSLKELENAPIDLWNKLGNQVYEVGKWTVKDIVQHYIDCERVFAYRIISIARGEKQKLLSFDEEEFAQNTNANTRTIEDLLEELILVRKSTIAMYKSFDDTMLLREGTAYNGIKYSPLALGFVIAGHQRHHLKVLEDRYYPLLNK